MADLTITAGSVLPGTDAVTTPGTAGETLTAGMAVYLKASDGKFWKAQSDGTAAEGAIIGVALNGASAGQPVLVQTGGTITIGATVVVGGIYIVSAAAGLICPFADIATLQILGIIGWAPSATTLLVKPQATAIVHA